MTWTSPLGIEFTLEAIYAGNALSNKAWAEWRDVNDPRLGQQLNSLIKKRSVLQEPLVQFNGFGRVSWTDSA